MRNKDARLTPFLLAALGFIAGVGPIGTDMYLSSFAEIQQDLNTSASGVQATLAVFLVGLGIGNLVFGTISDILGRRRVLIAAISLFALSSIAMPFTPNAELLIALRFIQGFSGAGGIVIARAIATDLSTGATAVRALSIIAMVGALGPLVAPPIGALTQAFWGWRGTFATLAALAILMLIVAVVVMPESLPKAKRHTGGLRTTFSAMGKLLRNPRYVLFTVVFACSFAGMMAYIAASPFVGQEVLGMTPVVYALSFATSGVGLVLANLANARIAPRVGPVKCLWFGLMLFLVSTIAIVLLVTTGTLTQWSFIACAFVMTFATGLNLANASALALQQAAHARGSGAALLGALQFIAGGFVAPVVGFWGEDTAVPMALAMLTCSCIAIFSAWFGTRAKGVSESAF